VPTPISFEEVARRPLPGMAVPQQLAFGPDDRVLTYLHSPERDLVRRLFVLDLEDPASEPEEVALEGAVTSDAELSHEEMLRRERARELGLGVTSAIWADKGDALMVPSPDGVRVVHGLAEGKARGARVVLAVGTGDGPVEDPRLSPDGSQLAFVRHGDVHVVATSGEGPVVRLTDSGGEGVSNGLAEYVAQEEMDRDHGLWWSPDGRHLAYTEVDERHVPLFRIVHQGAAGPGGPPFEDHRYPFAGEANARVRLGVVPAAGGDTVWMDLGPEDRYLARVRWLPDGALVAEVESRDQTSLELVRLDPASGEATVLLEEASEVWLNLSDDFRALERPAAGGERAFLWSSERTGFRHLELRAGDGSLVRVLTEGAWTVDALEGVDEEGGTAFFTGTRDGATECHLYAVALDGGPVRRLSPEPGVHDVTVGRSGRLAADRFSSLAEPPRVVVRSLADGAVVRTLEVGEDPRIAELELTPPEIVSLAGADGTELYGLVFRPEPAAGVADGVRLPPLVVHVYGGPQVQVVQNSWACTVMLRAQALRRLGCACLALDNRGSSRRGLAFEGAVRHDMGHVEVDDQVAGVRWALDHGLGDPARVAVNGWSYGGYMSLLCLARAPQVFTAAVAGAPVTHWDGYDTHYTERYMGTPQENPDGYEQSSVMAHAAGIRGRLLLVHGLLDENVHFRHTARLIDRLVAERVPYSLLVFPDERHMPRRMEDRAFMEEQVVGFLLESLA